MVTSPRSSPRAVTRHVPSPPPGTRPRWSRGSGPHRRPTHRICGARWYRRPGRCGGKLLLACCSRRRSSRQGPPPRWAHPRPPLDATPGATLPPGRLGGRGCPAVPDLEQEAPPATVDLGQRRESSPASGTEPTSPGHRCGGLVLQHIVAGSSTVWRARGGGSPTGADLYAAAPPGLESWTPGRSCAPASSGWPRRVRKPRRPWEEEDVVAAMARRWRSARREAALAGWWEVTVIEPRRRSRRSRQGSPPPAPRRAGFGVGAGGSGKGVVEDLLVQRPTTRTGSASAQIRPTADHPRGRPPRRRRRMRAGAGGRCPGPHCCWRPLFRHAAALP
jgi:hypothetical protein